MTFSVSIKLKRPDFRQMQREKNKEAIKIFTCVKPIDRDSFKRNDAHLVCALAEITRSEPRHIAQVFVFVIEQLG